MGVLVTDLGAEVLGRGVRVRVVGGDLYEAVAVVLRDGLSDALGALHVHVFEGEVSTGGGIS